MSTPRLVRTPSSFGMIRTTPKLPDWRRYRKRTRGCRESEQSTDESSARRTARAARKPRRSRYSLTSPIIPLSSVTRYIRSIVIDTDVFPPHYLFSSPCFSYSQSPAIHNETCSLPWALGSLSHYIESQLVAAARILEVDAEFIHLPNLIVVFAASLGAILLHRRAPLLVTWREKCEAAGIVACCKNTYCIYSYKIKSVWSLSMSTHLHSHFPISLSHLAELRRNGLTCLRVLVAVTSLEKLGEGVR